MQYGDDVFHEECFRNIEVDEPTYDQQNPEDELEAELRNAMSSTSRSVRSMKLGSGIIFAMREENVVADALRAVRHDGSYDSYVLFDTCADDHVCSNNHHRLPP